MSRVRSSRLVLPVLVAMTCLSTTRSADSAAFSEKDVTVKGKACATSALRRAPQALALSALQSRNPAERERGR